MSLIITSNRLTENKGVQRGQIPTEDPANYKNFFRSPIEIEPDSEIAVVSTKIERSANISLNDNSYFCHYFGSGEEVNPGDEYPYLTSISRNIPLQGGNYNFDAFSTHIQQRMRAQYAHPAIFGQETCKARTNSSTGAAEGIDIKFTSQPSASSSDVKADIVATPVFNINSPSNACADENASSFQGTYTPGTGVFERDGTDSDSFDNASCVVMLKNRPFGLSQGKFDLNISNTTKRFAIGLSRPQIQYHGNSVVMGFGDEVYDLDFRTTNKSEHNRFIINVLGQEEIEGPYEMYDYAVIQNEQDRIMVVERAFDPLTGFSVHQELQYWSVAGGVGGTNRMTRTTFDGKYDGIRFEGVGDEIYLYFKDKGKTTYSQVVGSNLENKPGRSFTPIGDTSYALYPMLNLGDGSVEVLKYGSGYSDGSYKFPTYLEGTDVPGSISTIAQLYTPGSDMFSNQAPVIRPGGIQPGERGIPNLQVSDSSYSVADMNNGRELVSGDVVSKIDRSLVKLRWALSATALGQPRNTLATYSYVGVIGGANHAVNYKHYLTMDKFIEPNPYDTLMPGQKFPNISAKLGYPDRAFALQDSGEAYVIGDGSRIVTFRSPFACERESKSAFIRIPGLTHKSYNGNQSSISKIVYQVPQFTNDGRQFGPLYFDAPEKTYVALHNPSTILLNHLEVQFVEANETVIKSFTGSSQVVFHIRKRK